MLLPSSTGSGNGEGTGSAVGGTAAGGPIVVHVEVKFGAADEHAYIVVVLWRADVQGGNALLSIRNDTAIPICVKQVRFIFM